MKRVEKELEPLSHIDLEDTEDTQCKAMNLIYKLLKDVVAENRRARDGAQRPPNLLRLDTAIANFIGSLETKLVVEWNDGLRERAIARVSEFIALAAPDCLLAGDNPPDGETMRFLEEEWKKCVREFEAELLAFVETCALRCKDAFNNAVEHVLTKKSSNIGGLSRLFFKVGEALFSEIAVRLTGWICMTCELSQYINTLITFDIGERWRKAYMELYTVCTCRSPFHE